MNFIKSNSLIIALLIIAVVFEIYRYIDEKKKEVSEIDEIEWAKRPLKGALFFLSLGFLLGIFISQRNGDFFVFFSAAYIVTSFNYFFDHIQISDVLVKKSIFIGIIIVVIFLFSANFLFLQDQIASAGPYDVTKGTADWLTNNAPKKSIIFNASWNWFTTLFYYDPNDYYVAGIEPRFLYDYNSKMYWAWWNISNHGYICYEQECGNLESQRSYDLKKEDRKNKWYKEEGDGIASVIKDTFKSKYVITSKDLNNFNDVMNNNNHFQKVFTDNVYNQFFVYIVN